MKRAKTRRTESGVILSYDCQLRGKTAEAPHGQGHFPAAAGGENDGDPLQHRPVRNGRPQPGHHADAPAVGAPGRPGGFLHSPLGGLLGFLRYRRCIKIT